MILESLPNVQNLTPVQKLQLVGELWDDLAAHPAEIPVPDEHLAELDRRMEAYRKDPSQVTTWQSVRDRLLARKVRGA